ncbi:MAG: hypothetical protein UV54_C0006G0011 [Candidatus Beckwithbacteria bacterium GW2011_GWA2_43_10]|uniref:Uncharacterized protein n=1 Tax=Candidatus Beckwithbacteria bacterium GW2011_GWA2_43_10 TaxID=1618369 RepID=A0A0G1EBJ7_9BACT|nr:MAG: hypothetical protein UV54_C0006G0011 [Candidatus Beckwithbacteria bacterium GW2011_GWA2_43_10]
MNQVVRLQLIAFAFFCLYFVFRFIGNNNVPLTIWQQVYWGNVVKDSFFLVFSLIFVYYLFNLLRRHQKTGPTIIAGSSLKIWLYIVIGFWWLAIVLHIIFDSAKIISPFNQFSFYQFSDLLDETISHIFMYLPFVFASIIGLFLEVERPYPKALSRKETIIIYILSLFSGLMWGVNLTEGRLSLITSFPAMLIYLSLTGYLFKKFKLNFKHRPLGLTYTIFYIFGAAAFGAWGLFFGSFPEFFNYLKQY